MKYEKIEIPPHYYSDCELHFRGSDGLCPSCYRIIGLVRVQRKISKLEERLNGEKNDVAKMVTT